MKKKNIGAFVAFATLTFLLTSMPTPNASALPASVAADYPTNFYKLGKGPELECQDSLETCCNEAKKTGSAPWRKPVECGFTCGIGSLLSIEVTSSDGAPFTVDVWGEATCAMKTAVCERSTKACAGVSTQPTERQGDGTCMGDSDDHWSSVTTVVCVATTPSIPCIFRESIPTIEEVQECAFLLSCTVEPVDSNGHHYGVSLCQYEDEDGQNYEHLCYYNYAVENCMDLSNATMIPYLPDSINLKPGGKLFEKLVGVFERHPVSEFSNRVIKIKDGAVSSELVCSGFACMEYKQTI